MYTYKINITKIYDGDTVEGIVDLGFNLKMDIKVRLARIDAPEIRTKDLEEKEKGYAARDFLRNFCKEYEGKILLRTTKKGKYGRWIGELLVPLDKLKKNDDTAEKALYINCSPFVTDLCINDLLVYEGYACYKNY